MSVAADPRHSAAEPASAAGRQRARRTPLPVLAALLLLAGCEDDGTGPRHEGIEVGIVVNSIDNSLTVFPVDSGPPIDIGLGSAGSPVAVAVRGRLAAVPLGIVPAVAIADLVDGVLVRTVALTTGSGATGAAFVNDSIVVVTNPMLGSVTPVNARAGTRAADVPVGNHPVDVLAVGDRVVVVNAEIGPDFQPAGPSTLTVLRASDLSRVGQITLSGENALAAVMAEDGRVYVIHAGRFGASNGSLSVVDVAGMREVSHHPGFGGFPGDVTATPDGRVHVASFEYGIAVWDPGAGQFVRPPANAAAPGGVPAVSGLGVDGEGRLWSLRPDCGAPGAAFLLSPALEVERTVEVGTCPIAITFALVPPA